MSLVEKIVTAASDGLLLDATLENAKCWAEADFLPDWVEQSMADLIEQGAWDELNDRFYQNLVFGTGGMLSLIHI